MLTLARIIRLAAGVVAAVIVAGILLHVLGANDGNAIVGAILDAARWLVGPFAGLFQLDDGKLQVAVNWGLAALVYYLVGALVARLLAGAAGGTRRRFGFARQRRRAHV